MLAQLTIGLALAAGSCAPAAAERALTTNDTSPTYTIDADCATHTVTFTIHAQPNHLYQLEYGSAPPMGSTTDANGDLTTTQTATYTGTWNADIYDPSTGEFLARQQYDCAAPACNG